MVQMKGYKACHWKTPALYFISHMVQMKDERGCCFNSHFSALYIPHGSDESSHHRMPWQSKDFLYIPHGSDERQKVRSSCRGSSSTFISHMVQMKESHLNAFLQFLRLYIPHGSDERIRLFNSSLLLSSLYIPHGSDERLVFLRKKESRR